MCARIYARMYARESDCGQIIIRTHDHDQHTNGTHDHRKREDSGKAGKSEYICMIADNEKKYKKVKKKFGNIKKTPYLCSRNQKTKQYEKDNNYTRQP